MMSSGKKKGGKSEIPGQFPINTDNEEHRVSRGFIYGKKQQRNILIYFLL